jgi:hypothetical protein
MEHSMKTIMVSIIVLALLFTFGCNYDYGKYGKDKKETEQKSETGEASN